MQNKLTYSIFDQVTANERLRELILYISFKSQKDERYCKTKLNKILFFADQLSYRKYGTAIMGGKYQKLKWGPAPHQMKPVLDSMENSKVLAVQLADYYGQPQERPIALREADLSKFSGRDIATIDQAIDFFWEYTATEISKQSHAIAWRTVEEKQPIPYESAYLSNEPVTERDVAIYKELAQKYGWGHSSAQ